MIKWSSIGSIRLGFQPIYRISLQLKYHFTLVIKDIFWTLVKSGWYRKSLTNHDQLWRSQVISLNFATNESVPDDLLGVYWLHNDHRILLAIKIIINQVDQPWSLLEPKGQQWETNGLYLKLGIIFGQWLMNSWTASVTIDYDDIQFMSYIDSLF